VGPRAGLDDVQKRKYFDPSVVQPIASRYTDYAIKVLLLGPYKPVPGIVQRLGQDLSFQIPFRSAVCSVIK
jgi:hypothetical protein